MEKREEAKVGAMERIPEATICPTPLTVAIGPFSGTLWTMRTCIAPVTEKGLLIDSPSRMIRSQRTVRHINHHLEAQLDGNPDRDKCIDAISSTGKEIEDRVKAYAANQAREGRNVNIPRSESSNKRPKEFELADGVDDTQ